MKESLENLSTAELIEQVRSDAFKAFKVAATDMDGVLRGKYMHRDKLISSLESGFGFCDVVLGWDTDDQLLDNLAYTGWRTAYPDVEVRLIPGAARRIPFEDRTLFLLAEFTGAAEAICPRGLLRRVLARAQAMGFTARCGFEFEFFVFAETPASVREKGYRGLNPLTPGAFGYSVLRNSVHAELYHEILDLCEEMRMPLESLHTETGPGVIEAALQAQDALEAADRATLFKTFAKIWAQRRGLMATFMAKWSPNWPGQSGHIHLSLADRAGAPVFHEAGARFDMSETMRWFVGGQQRLMPELLALIASRVNSFTRLTPGFWAPTSATWGAENRTTALRVIGGGPRSQRVEHRVAAADINPYIALSAALGSGLWGIENRIEPTAPVAGNAYAQVFPAELAFPASLGEAAERLKASSAANELFGAEFVDHFAATRLWEERQFRASVTSWELERYFEII
jgi:glutamine synthetase